MNTDRFKYRAYIKSLNLLIELRWYCLESNGSVSMLTAEGRMMNVKQDDVTLEQCTGLKDKNGRLIFEGDVCRDSRLGKAAILKTIIFKDGCFGWESNSVEKDFFPIAAGNHYEERIANMEVVGNIHESEASK